VWESRPVDGPDGFAIARSGNVYIALLAANQLAVIGPDGRERQRFPAGPGGENGSSVPFDNPSSARFLGTRLMVANQSYVTGNASHQAILDVEAGEEGLPELIPAGPAEAGGPAVPAGRLVLTKRRARAAARRHLRRRGSKPRVTTCGRTSMRSFRCGGRVSPRRGSCERAAYRVRVALLANGKLRVRSKRTGCAPTR
jgi:hypothetical protein